MVSMDAILVQETKFFDCTCQRCGDASELGTHLSSLVCQVCPDGVVVAEELLLTSLGKSMGFSCSMSEKVYSFCKIYIQIILFFALRVPRALCLRAKIMLYNIFTYYKFTAEDDAPMADAAEQELLGGRAGTPVFNHDEPRPSTPIDPPEGLLNGALSVSTPVTTDGPGEMGENSKNLSK